MGRLYRLLCVVVILAAAAPAVGAPSRKTVGCGAALPSYGTASCSTKARLPHFNNRDRIDYSTLVARVVSPQAMSWRVTGAMTDARGVLYFTWTCNASRSSVAMGNETYLEKSCDASRKTVPVRRNGRTHLEYYVADTSRPQRIDVWAEVGMCAPGCRFEGAAQYVFAS
ncbi:MAG: hypothetical protein WAT66_05770 [Actinomycetota bacterium]